MRPIDHADLVGLMLSAPELIPLDDVSGLRGDLRLNRRSVAIHVDAVDLVRRVATLRIPEMDRTQNVYFTADTDLMEHAVWYPEERLQALVAIAMRVVSGRAAVSDEDAMRKRQELRREEFARLECGETRLLDPALLHKARCALMVLLEQHVFPLDLDWNRTLRDLAFCQGILAIRSDRERMFVSDMIARARYMTVTPSLRQAAWLRAVLRRSKERIRPGSGAVRSQLHQVFPILAMTDGEDAAKGASPA